MRATTSQVTMQEYASDNTEYKSSPNDNQTAAGVVPLDTLPAAWWNWLWSMVTKNNNAIYLSIGDLRDEMLAVLTNAGLTPSDTVTNQLLQAIEIIRKRFPTTDAVSSDPVPGAVISSSDIKSVSVSETTGQMVVNALADWVGTDTVREFLTTMQAALMALVAPAFSETATYAEGDYVIYNDTLYRFSAAKEAGDWDPTKAEQMIVSNLLKEHTTKVDTAISTLTTEVSDAIDSLTTQVDDAIDTMEETINNRAHVMAVQGTVMNNVLTIRKHADGSSIKTYVPQPNDILLVTLTDGNVPVSNQPPINLTTEDEGTMTLVVSEDIPDARWHYPSQTWIIKTYDATTKIGTVQLCPETLPMQYVTSSVDISSYNDYNSNYIWGFLYFDKPISQWPIPAFSNYDATNKDLVCTYAISLDAMPLTGGNVHFETSDIFASYEVDVQIGAALNSEGIPTTEAYAKVSYFNNKECPSNIRVKTRVVIIDDAKYLLIYFFYPIQVFPLALMQTNYDVSSSNGTYGDFCNYIFQLSYKPHVCYSNFVIKDPIRLLNRIYPASNEATTIYVYPEHIAFHSYSTTLSMITMAAKWSCATVFNYCGQQADEDRGINIGSVDHLWQPHKMPEIYFNSPMSDYTLTAFSVHIDMSSLGYVGSALFDVDYAYSKQAHLTWFIYNYQGDGGLLADIVQYAAEETYIYIYTSSIISTSALYFSRGSGSATINYSTVQNIYFDGGTMNTCDVTYNAYATQSGVDMTFRNCNVYLKKVEFSSVSTSYYDAGSPSQNKYYSYFSYLGCNIHIDFETPMTVYLSTGMAMRDCVIHSKQIRQINSSTTNAPLSTCNALVLCCNANIMTNVQINAAVPVILVPNSSSYNIQYNRFNSIDIHAPALYLSNLRTWTHQVAQGHIKIDMQFYPTSADYALSEYIFRGAPVYLYRGIGEDTSSAPLSLQLDIVGGDTVRLAYALSYIFPQTHENFAPVNVSSTAVSSLTVSSQTVNKAAPSVSPAYQFGYRMSTSGAINMVNILEVVTMRSAIYYTT